MATGWKDALQSCSSHAAHMSSIWWSSDSRLPWERRVRERRKKRRSSRSSSSSASAPVVEDEEVW